MEGSSFTRRQQGNFLGSLTVKENLSLWEKVFISLCLAYFWSLGEGLFLELQYNPSSKNRRFFGGSNQTSGESQSHDFFEGTMKKYKK